MLSFYKNFLSIIFLPFIFAFFLSLNFFFPILNKNLMLFSPLILGFIFYFIIHFKFNKKISKFYVFAHELSHALFGFFSGNKINKIKINKNSGYVVFNKKTNLLTILAPYIFPFYAFIFSLIYFLISIYKNISSLRPFFLFIIGFSLTFHFLNTFENMTASIQSDFKKTKTIFFSYTLVIILNLIIISISLKMLYPNSFSLYSFYIEILNNVRKIYSFIFNIIFVLINKSLEFKK